MKINRISLLLLVLAVSIAGRGFADGDEVYKDLLKDVVFECDHFDELQDPQDRKAVENFKMRWQAYLSDSSPRASQPPLRLTLSNGRVFILDMTTVNAPKNYFTFAPNLNLPSPVSGKASSMKDVQGYVANRIGPNTLETLSQHPVDVQVIGGDGAMPGQWSKVPSFYEKWGIQKFLVKKGDQETLVFKVPPIKEYVQHYLGMLDAAGIHSAKGFLDQTARDRLKSSLGSAAKILVSALISPKAHPWVVLGYSSTLEAELVAQEKAGLIQGLRVSLRQGSHAAAKALNFTVNGQERQMILIYSDLTLWGEGSSYLVEGALDAGVEGVMFMGSAGNLSRKSGVYGSTAPTEFLDENFEKIPVKNFLASGDQKITHAATYSPIEETVEHTDFLLSKKVDTIDVEVIKIAETVAEYQKSEGSHPISFGVVNLITDLPVSTQFPDHVEFNLDQVSTGQKSESKASIVKRFFRGWISRPENLPCDGPLIK